MSDSIGRKSASARSLFDAAKSFAAAQQQPPEPVARGDRLFASESQQCLWFLEQYYPNTSMHNLSTHYCFEGDLDPDALNSAISAMVQRHEILRTTFYFEDKTLYQRINDRQGNQLDYQDLRDQETASLTNDKLDFLIGREAHEPFNLEEGTLYRFSLLRTRDKEFHLLFTIHHMIFDGWSFELFMKELSTLYQSHLENTPPAPSDSQTANRFCRTIQYADYAQWQREQLSRRDFSEHLDYWQSHLEGASQDSLLRLDHPVTRNSNLPGSGITIRISAQVRNRLEALAAKEGVTSFMLLYAIFNCLLFRINDEKDFVIGTPTAGRLHRQFQDVIGMFVNLVPLRTPIHDGMTFADLLDATRTNVGNAYRYQELPFDRLVNALQLERSAYSLPLADVMFNYLRIPTAGWSFPGIRTQVTNIVNATAKCQLSMTIGEEERGLYVLLEYNSSLFEASTINGYLEGLVSLIDEVIAAPEKKLVDYSIVSPEQEKLQSSWWNQETAVCSYPGSEHSVTSLFYSRVKENADAIALVQKDTSLTYAQLNRLSNQLAHYLLSSGVAPQTSVGIHLPRSPDFLIAMLAILKAGAAYVPVGDLSTYSTNCLTGVNLAALITNGNEYGRLEGLSGQIIQIEVAKEEMASHSEQNLCTDISPHDIAYVMFTSGTTGVQKGVKIPHRGVIRLVDRPNYTHINHNDRLLHLSPTGFDASTFEIWGALLNGARLVIAPATQPSLSELGELLTAHEITILWLTTGLFHALADQHVPISPTLKQLLTGGEVLSVASVKKFLENNPGCSLTNMYGPTENTTFSTFFPVTLPVSGDPIAIGRPVSGTQVYILDRFMHPVPIGIQGEIHVGGRGLMSAYIDAESRVAGLVDNPFSDDPESRLYPTGDTGRYRADGNIEFCGRKDSQVKIRGFRINPENLESLFRQIPSVKDCVLSVGYRQDSSKFLLATVVPEDPRILHENGEQFVVQLRRSLSRIMPAYLLPARISLAEGLPLNDRGKVDRERVATRISAGEPDTAAESPCGPTDPYQNILSAIFRDVLGVTAISPVANFFDLGGDSLLSLSAVAEIESTFHIKLPLADFLESPTVINLASKIRYLARTQNMAPSIVTRIGSTLVEIRRGTSHKPLFVVPGGHGGLIELTLYARAFAHMTSEHPVFGFVAKGISNDEDSHSTVEEMASAYITQMRQVQPNGPYALTGECVGGVIAFEMAQQLSALGEPVALLLMMDTWCPGEESLAHYENQLLPKAIRRERKHFLFEKGTLLSGAFTRKLRALPVNQPGAWINFIVSCIRAVPGTYRLLVSHWNNIGHATAAEKNYIDMAMQYRPTNYSKPVHFLTNETNSANGISNDWGEVIEKPLKIFTVPGNHENYFTESAQEIAGYIDKILKIQSGL